MSSLFIVFQNIVPQHLLSRLVGFFAQSRLFSRPFISFFKWKYDINLSEAVIEESRDFATFNEFFTRELKPGLRPLPADKDAIVSPADGEISQAGKITQGMLLQAKGHNFSVNDLLHCDEDVARRFHSGLFATVYLSPRDYHRVHLPFSGTLLKTVYIPGDLYSVNQKTAESVPNLFARNERLVCFFETELGTMGVVLVGAMIVAGIETVWSGHICPSHKMNSPLTTSYENENLQFKTGDEIGRFKLGSTAIVLFENDVANFEADIVEGKLIKMGELMGKPSEKQ